MSRLKALLQLKLRQQHHTSIDPKIARLLDEQIHKLQRSRPRKPKHEMA